MSLPQIMVDATAIAGFAINPSTFTTVTDSSATRAFTDMTNNNSHEEPPSKDEWKMQDVHE